MKDPCLEFNEIVMTRFCHDISSPISAIGGGIEFIEINHDEKLNEKALELMQENYAQCCAKIKFFRYLYGKYSDAGEIEKEDFLKLIYDFCNNTKTDIVITDFEINLTHLAAKTLISIIYVVFYSLASGGKIKMTSNQHKVDITATGKKIKDFDSIYQIISSGGAKGMTPDISNIHTYYAAKIVQTSKTQITLIGNKESEVSLSLSFLR